ncbi:BTBD9 [Mytilus edulis]|uniref:BTB/POZ domain-containing protein 9 n=1 Tax=Mytilus edulis TaxID=6550 RepID=A0A8S3Q1K4_MYTED|nr:BTBD9 [Mytilus edulis]
MCWNHYTSSTNSIIVPALFSHGVHTFTFSNTAGIVDHVSSLSENLGELVDSADYSDITLIVEDDKYQSHKVILAARSDYFRALLFGGMRESQPGTTEIELKDTSSTAFSVLLKYIYTGRINLLEIKEENLLDILGMSHRYGFMELASSISDYLKAILNINNVCLIYDIANMYSLMSLCQVCKEFIDRNALDILHGEAFLTLSQSSVKDLICRDSFCSPEIEIFNSIVLWAEHNTGQDPTPILDAIRLPLMNMQELLNKVRPTKLVSPDSILDAIKVQTECRNMELKYRGLLVVDENVATTRFGAQVMKGEMKQALLDGDSSNYDLDRGFTRHPIDDNYEAGVVIKLAQPYILNTFKLLLWDRDMRSYSYFIEVSMDDKDYEKVIDHTKYLCRSWQILHFPPRVVRFVRVLEQGLIVPSENVATITASACVIEGVSRSRNALINGDIRHYDWDSGYTCHQLGSGAVIVQLAQPYIVDSMRLLLWDCDDRSYSYYIEVSIDQKNWHMVIDKRNEPCKSWQHITFDKRPVAFVKIVGTSNTANEVFHCVHFECPAETSINMSNQGGACSLPVNPSGSASNNSIQTPSSENYISAEYSPQDAPEADRMDTHDSSDSES